MVDRLIDVPEARTVPSEVLGALRAIDDRAELIYAGNGVWWLGTVNPSTDRRELAAALLKHEEKRPRPSPMNVLLGMAALQGFGLIWQFKQNDPDGRIVNEFRARDFAWRNMDDHDAEFERKLDDIDTDVIKARKVAEFYANYIPTDGRSIFRMVKRGGPRVMVGGGLTAGRK